MIICPACEGEGGHREIIDYYIGGPWYDCGMCDGEGEIGLRDWLHYQYWVKAPAWLTERHISYLSWLWDVRWKLADWCVKGGLTRMLADHEHRSWMSMKDQLYHMKIDSERLPRAQERATEAEDKYWGLLHKVVERVPGETRHETALRILRQAQQSSDQAMEAPNE